MTTTLRFTEPYSRAIQGEPWVVLTEPRRYALTIAPDGQLVVRSLLGVSAKRVTDPLTSAQHQTLLTVELLVNQP